MRLGRSGRSRQPTFSGCFPRLLRIINFTIRSKVPLLLSDSGRAICKIPIVAPSNRVPEFVYPTRRGKIGSFLYWAYSELSCKNAGFRGVAEIPMAGSHYARCELDVRKKQFREQRRNVPLANPHR